VALIIGCVMLYLELDMFEFKHQGAPAVSWLSPAPLRLAGLALSPSWSTDALATVPLLPV
jgi:hypothetical protein